MFCPCSARLGVYKIHEYHLFTFKIFSELFFSTISIKLEPLCFYSPFTYVNIQRKVLQDGLKSLPFFWCQFVMVSNDFFKTI